MFPFLICFLSPASFQNKCYINGMYTREPKPNVWCTLKRGEESEEDEEESSEEEEEDLDVDKSMDSGTSNEWGAFQ